MTGMTGRHGSHMESNGQWRREEEMWPKAVPLRSFTDGADSTYAKGRHVTTVDKTDGSLEELNTALHTC